MPRRSSSSTNGPATTTVDSTRRAGPPWQQRRSRSCRRSSPDRRRHSPTGSAEQSRTSHEHRPQSPEELGHHGHLLRGADAGPSGEHVVAARLDLVEDRPIQRVGGARRTAPIVRGAWRCRPRPRHTTVGTARSRIASSATNSGVTAGSPDRRRNGSCPRSGEYWRPRSRSSSMSRRKSVSWNALPRSRACGSATP